MREFIDIVFDGPPGPQSGHFVEVEDMQGKSIRVGEWIERNDGMWALRMDAPEHRHQFLPWLSLPNGSSWTKCATCDDAEMQYDH